MTEDAPIDAELLKDFIADADPLLDKAPSLLAALDADSNDKEAIHELFRISHNIKGNAGYMNLGHINKLAHRLEELLLMVREKEDVFTEQISQVLQQGFSEIREMLNRLKSGQSECEDENSLAPLLEEITNAVDEIKKRDTVGLWKVLTADINTLTEKLNTDNPEVIALFSRIVFNVAALSPIGKESPEDVSALKKTVQAKPAAAQAKAVNTPISKPSKPKSPEVFDALIETIINVSNKLEDASTALNVISSSCDCKELQDFNKEFLKIASELTANVYSLKLVPASTMLERVPIMAGDLAKRLNKKIQVTINGGGIMVNREQLDALEWPLTHMVRNSMDHGIELPDIRKSKGKLEKGTISVSMEDTGKTIVLALKDDGKGIDTTAVKWKAVAKGLLDPARASTVTDEEIYRILFEPGFSTSDVATDISGRGVGMDVVKNTVESMGGKIQLKSEMDKGMEIIITLPKKI